MTPYEASSLWAQWVGSVSGALAVVVAAVFGYLTLASNRRSKDAQQRATLVAAFDDPDQHPSLLASRETGGPHFSVRHKTGETWLLLNNGPDVAYMVDIDGLTELDKRRLHDVALDPASLGEGEATEFRLTSRYTLSGPANIVVSYRLQPGGAQRRRILQVPAP